jgi:hypothetical protein
MSHSADGLIGATTHHGPQPQPPPMYGTPQYPPTYGGTPYFPPPLINSHILLLYLHPLVDHHRHLPYIHLFPQPVVPPQH